ncbi:[protein-PII] uridylyltransferase, partial [Gordonia alkanivorans]|nr:[protein-PII] uridylyltransferase [Gordonia alkanivorans]
DGKAINSFIVVPMFGSPPDAGLLRQQLIAAVNGKLDVLARLDARERDSPIPTIASVSTLPGTMVSLGASAGSTDPDVDGAGHPKNAVPALFAVAPPRVTWLDAPEPDAAEGAVLLEVRSDDRIGLLSRVSSVLEKFGADIRWAKVSTLGATVVDIFSLRLAPNAETADTEQLRATITDAIIAVCPPPQPKRDEEDGPQTPGGTGRSGVPIS